MYNNGGLYGGEAAVAVNQTTQQVMMQRGSAGLKPVLSPCQSRAREVDRIMGRLSQRMVKGTAHILSRPQPKATSSLLEAGQRGFSQLHLDSCPLAKPSSASIPRGNRSKPLSTRHFSTDHLPASIARATNLSTHARTKLAPTSIRLQRTHGSKRSYASGTGLTPNSSQSALVKYTPPTGPLDRVDRAKLLSAAPTFLARLKIRLKLLLMRQIRPWRVDDFIAMFSWAFLANVAFVLLGTTTFFSLILATANSLQFQGKKEREKERHYSIRSGSAFVVVFFFPLAPFGTNLTHEKLCPTSPSRKAKEKKRRHSDITPLRDSNDMRPFSLLPILFSYLRFRCIQD